LIQFFKWGNPFERVLRNGIAIDMQQFVGEYRVAPFFWNRVSKSYYSLALFSIIDQRINRGEISLEGKRGKR
jgi:hypothetical protein